MPVGNDPERLDERRFQIDCGRIVGACKATPTSVKHTLNEMALKHVAAAIVIKEGKVLVTRRGPGEKLEGHWEFPGGKLECGERPQDCIVRELAEELGVTSIC